jgi:hypothetical protein
MKTDDLGALFNRAPRQLADARQIIARIAIAILELNGSDAKVAHGGDFGFSNLDFGSGRVSSRPGDASRSDR